jgi:hypothetical protein
MEFDLPWMMERLRVMVDQYAHVQPVPGTLVLLRLTFRDKDDPKNAITLTVGAEPVDDDDGN